MRKLIRFLSVILMLSVIASMLVPSVCAFESNNRVYEYTFEDYSFSVSYVVAEDVIVETISIISSGNECAIVAKKVYPNGTVDVYTDNAFVASYDGCDFEAYLHAAQGTLDILEANPARAYGCGYSATHMYVDVSTSTIDIAKRNLTVSALASIISGFLHPAVGAVVGVSVAIAQYAFSSGVDYIDITEYKYYVHDADLMRDMNCFHTKVVYYSYTSSGAKDIYAEDWEYYQYLL